MKSKILFVCIHNSARSQMAEAFINRLGAPALAAESAGLEAGRLNPLVVAAMREKGIDISANRTKGVDAMLASGRQFDYAITVCDEASAERCPVFPAATRRLHWSFPDPSLLGGTPEERLARTREIRDAIEAKCRAWMATLPG